MRPIEWVGGQNEWEGSLEWAGDLVAHTKHLSGRDVQDEWEGSLQWPGSETTARGGDWQLLAVPQGHYRGLVEGILWVLQNLCNRT